MSTTSDDQDTESMSHESRKRNWEEIWDVEDAFSGLISFEEIGF